MHHGKSRGERFCRNLGGKCINNRSLKAYIVLLFLDTFRNKSGKPQPIWTKVGTHTKFRERCRPWTWVCVPTLVRIGCGLPAGLIPESVQK